MILNSFIRKRNYIWSEINLKACNRLNISNLISHRLLFSSDKSFEDLKLSFEYLGYFLNRLKWEQFSSRTISLTYLISPSILNNRYTYRQTVKVLSKKLRPVILDVNMPNGLHGKHLIDMKMSWNKLSYLTIQFQKSRPHTTKYVLLTQHVLPRLPRSTTLTE